MSKVSDPAETEPAPQHLFTGVVPHLNVDGASEASTFYQRAFGAEELARMPHSDGVRLMHCHLFINGGSIMLADCFPEHGVPHDPSQSYTMHLQVPDVDAWWTRAVEAGAQVVVPLQEMFWGDKYGKLRDPFGVSWSLASTIKKS